MLKKTITYKDLDDNEVTDDFYFNLSKAEIAEMELSYEGGLSEQLKRIVAAKDSKLIIATFKDIITKSYGKRSEDGKRFMKSEDISNEFLQTGAYDAFFMELITNAEASAEFVRSIVPSDLAAQVPNTLAGMDEKDPKKTFYDYNHDELVEMPQEEFEALVGRDPHKMSQDQLVVAMQRKNR